MKIFICGQACSGKSTLAKDLSNELSLPVIHMDSIIWKDNWVKEDDYKYKRKEREALERSQWIFEGFNPHNLGAQVRAADIVIFIKISKIKQTYHWLKRLRTYKNMNRQDMPAGNTERFNWSYLKWLLKYKDKELLAIIKKHNPSRLLIIKSGIDASGLAEDIRKSPGKF